MMWNNINCTLKKCVREYNVTEIKVFFNDDSFIVSFIHMSAF